MTPAERLALVRDRIDRARAIARRDDEVTLIAVSKGHVAGEIEPLLAAGQRHFGENRVQEAAEKWPPLKARFPDVTLHMMGRLQSNKAAEAAALFDVIHSLDRASLLEALDRCADPPPCFVQVNVGAEEQKGGMAIEGLEAFLGQVRASGLSFAGLMAIPPLGGQPGPYFALLAKLARRHGVTALSMGMSADYETAVMLGATHVRVGTALFGDD
jgi:pyridoxal phosphate enzyme (YggS family)